MTNLKTIKELADELQLDKKRVEYQASKLSNDLVPKIDGIKYITNEAEMKIRDELKDASTPKIDTDSGNHFLVKYQLNILEKELQHKSDQLDAKDNQLDQLYKLLAQQQQIQLATIHQVEQLQQQTQILLDEKHPITTEVEDKKDDIDSNKQLSNINDSFNALDHQKKLARRKRKRTL